MLFTTKSEVESVLQALQANMAIFMGINSVIWGQKSIFSQDNFTFESRSQIQSNVSVTFFPFPSTAGAAEMCCVCEQMSYQRNEDLFSGIEKRSQITPYFPLLFLAASSFPQEPAPVLTLLVTPIKPPVFVSAESECQQAWALITAVMSRRGGRV